MRTSAGMPSREARAFPWATLNGPKPSPPPVVVAIASLLLALAWGAMFRQLLSVAPPGRLNSTLGVVVGWV